MCVGGGIKAKQMSEQKGGLKRREDFVHRRCQMVTCAARRKNNNRPVQKKTQPISYMQSLSCYALKRSDCFVAVKSMGTQVRLCLRACRGGYKRACKSVHFVLMFNIHGAISVNIILITLEGALTVHKQTQSEAGGCHFQPWRGDLMNWGLEL